MKIYYCDLKRFKPKIYEKSKWKQPCFGVLDRANVHDIKIMSMEIQNDVTLESTSEGESGRVKLKVVVQACAKRWFEENLAAAQRGDYEMQLLVGEMFNSGYGVERDPVKVLSISSHLYRFRKHYECLRK